MLRLLVVEKLADPDRLPALPVFPLVALIALSDVSEPVKFLSDAFLVGDRLVTEALWEGRETSAFAEPTFRLDFEPLDRPFERHDFDTEATRSCCLG